MNRRVQEGLSACREGALQQCEEMISAAMREARQGLRTEVNASLKTGMDGSCTYSNVCVVFPLCLGLRVVGWHVVVDTQHLRDGLNDLDQRLKEQLQRMTSLETAMAAVRDTSFRAESDASHAVSLSNDNKDMCSRCEDALLRLGHDVEGLDKLVQRLRELDSPSSPYHKSYSNGIYIRRDTGGDINIQTLQDALREVASQVARQDERLMALTKVLEEHRNDYQEVVSHLSTAARKAKAGHKELSERVLAIGDIKRSVEQVLNDVILSSEGDREALETMKAETASALKEIDTLRSSIIELAEIMPTPRAISESVQDHISAFHNDEVVPLNDKVAYLEQLFKRNVSSYVSPTNYCNPCGTVNSMSTAILNSDLFSSQHTGSIGCTLGRDQTDSNTMHQSLQEHVAGGRMALKNAAYGAEGSGRSNFTISRLIP